MTILPSLEIVPDLLATVSPMLMVIPENLAEVFSKYSWVAYGLIAWLLFTSQKVSRCLSLGVAVMAINTFVWFYARHNEGGYGSASFEFARNISRIAYPASIILLVIGAVRTFRDSRGAAGTLAPPGSDPTQDQSSLVVPRSAETTLARAVELRDSIYATLEAICANDGVQVISYKSDPHQQEVWLKFDYSMPQETPDVTLRASIQISVERFDFHRFEHIFTAEVTHAGRKWVVTGLHTVNEEAILLLHRCALLGKNLAQLFEPVLPGSLRIRQHPIQFWRPANRIKRLRPDWAARIVLVVLALLLLVPDAGVVLAFLGLIIFVAVELRKKRHVLTAGKPLLDPRFLVRMDSWQASLEGLGGLADETREELLSRLTASSNGRVLIQPEHIWHMGVDGKVERQQVVIAFRRAYGFIHIEPYGDDLYVGWDTHLNAGTWMEKRIATGVDRHSGKNVVANRVVSAVQALTEYDVTDVSFLTEWLHTTTVRLVKLKLEQYKIDQEIDFTIQRESRKNALAKREGTDAKAKDGGGLLQRLRTKRVS